MTKGNRRQVRRQALGACAAACAAAAWSGADALSPAPEPVPASPSGQTGQTGAPAPTVVGGGASLLDRERTDRAPPALAPTLPAATPNTPLAVLRQSAPVAPFVVRDVRVEGATAPRALVRSAIRPFVGKTVDAAGAGAIADALAAAYAASDVAISTVVLPGQDFRGGVVRLRVIEGRLEGVDVQAKDARLAARVRAITSPLLLQHPLRRSAFDRAWLLVQSIPGAKASASFARGGHTGSVRLIIKIKTRRLKAALGVSDRGQNLLGRTQVTFTAQAQGLLRAGDQTSLVIAAPTSLRRFLYVGVSHQQPIGADGAFAQLSLGRLTTRPKGLSTNGEATVASLAVSWPAILSATRTLTLTASLDGVESKNALLGQVISDERTRALRGAAAFVQGFDKGQGSVSLAATLSQGLDGLGARMVARGYARPDFRKLTFQAAAVHRYGKWTVRLRASGQAADGPVPASEQFTLGGDDFGRAFDSGVAMGDAGAAASAELGYSPTLHLPHLQGLEAYLFADAGRARSFSRPALGLRGRTDELASIGLGARATVAAHTALQIEAAHGLVEETPYRKGDDWRLIVGVRSSY